MSITQPIVLLGMVMDLCMTVSGLVFYHLQQYFCIWHRDADHYSAFDCSWNFKLEVTQPK